MAKLSFGQRYREDKRFQMAVEDIQREAIFRMMGVDPEVVAAAWNGKELVFGGPLPVGVTGGQPPLFTLVDGETVVSPVADLDGKSAGELIDEARKNGDTPFLQAVFAAETRSSIAMAAARALFDLRSAPAE